MPPKTLQNSFASRLFLLGLLCHAGSYFLPLVDPYSNQVKFFGTSLWKEILLYSFDWEHWKEGWFIFLSIYCPPLTFIGTLLYFRWKRSMPSMILLIVGMLLPNFILPFMFVYRQFVLKQQVPIMWGYYAFILSFGLFFWSFYSYKNKHSSYQNHLSDHLIED